MYINQSIITIRKWKYWTSSIAQRQLTMARTKHHEFFFLHIMVRPEAKQANTVGGGGSVRSVDGMALWCMFCIVVVFVFVKQHQHVFKFHFQNHMPHTFKFKIFHKRGRFSINYSKFIEFSIQMQTLITILWCRSIKILDGLFNYFFFYFVLHNNFEYYCCL